MAELKFCPKCGQERENENVSKCSGCGYVYPKKGLSTGCIVGIVIAALFIPTIIILPLIAALTIPTLVNRQNDLAAMTKLKKAIANYEDFAYVYMLEKDKKSLTGAFTPNCDNVRAYFKAVEQDGCNFTTVDGAYWEVDPRTGYMAVTDSKDMPKYGVVLWAVNGVVNDEKNAPENLKMPSKEPLHCIFYPQTFARSTSSQLKELCKK